MRAILQKSCLLSTRPLARNLIPCSVNSGNALFGRAYSQNSPKPSTTKRDIPSFKNIFFMALVGTGVFVFAVDSLERNKKKATYSDSEYAIIMKGLKRRVTMFNPGELDVHMIYPSKKDVNQKILSTIKSDSVIDPFEVVESFRLDPEGRYEAILNDIRDTYGEKDYIHHLPEKMLVSLIKDDIKRNCKKGQSVTIINFPTTMSDAMNFENEISQIKQLYVPKSEKNSDICKYFETVDRVTFT